MTARVRGRFLAGLLTCTSLTGLTAVQATAAEPLVSQPFQVAQGQPSQREEELKRKEQPPQQQQRQERREERRDNRQDNRQERREERRDTRQENKQERRDDRKDVREERRDNRQDNRQERREVRPDPQQVPPRVDPRANRIEQPPVRQDARPNQGEQRQDFRVDQQGRREGVPPTGRPDVRPDGRDPRQDFRVDQKGRREDVREERRDDRKDFREERRDDRKDFREDRRDDRRDFRQDRRDDNRDAREAWQRRRLDDIKRERRERVEEGGRRIIEEPDRRVIVREHGRAVIRHDENERFRRGFRDQRVERRNDGSTVSSYTGRDGRQVFSVMDRDGRLLHRYRRGHDGRIVVLIDNRRYVRPGLGGIFLGGYVDLRPPIIRIPREKYIVDYERASYDDIYEALAADPVDDIERAYSLDEIRQSQYLRDRVRRVDLDSVNFEFGSWEVPPEQYGRLERIARAINRVLDRHSDAVFMVEGHTDAVGSDEDNLTLSDRRAESVAMILSDEFGVPPENLITQGYGEQFLKVDTQGPEVLNRRVAVRNISRLLSRSER